MPTLLLRPVNFLTDHLAKLQCNLTCLTSSRNGFHSHPGWITSRLIQLVCSPDDLADRLADLACAATKPKSSVPLLSCVEVQLDESADDLDSVAPYLWLAPVNLNSRLAALQSGGPHLKQCPLSLPSFPAPLQNENCCQPKRFNAPPKETPLGGSHRSIAAQRPRRAAPRNLVGTTSTSSVITPSSSDENATSRTRWNVTPARFGGRPACCSAGGAAAAQRPCPGDIGMDRRGTAHGPLDLRVEQLHRNQLSRMSTR